MVFGSYHMADGLVRVRRIGKNVQSMLERAIKSKTPLEEEEIEMQVRSFYSALLDVYNGANELHHVVEGHRISSFIEIVEVKNYLHDVGIPLLLEYQTAETIITIAEELDTKKARLDIIFRHLSWANDLRDCFRYDYTRVLPQREIEDILMERLFRSISPGRSEEPIKVLEFAPYPDYNAASVIGARHAAFRVPAKFYAADVSEDLRPHLLPHYEKLALGRLRGSTISNGAFDMMVIHAKPDMDKNMENPLFSKTEKDQLRDTAKYLRPDGLLVLAIPYYRFHRDVTVILAKHYCSFEVRKMEGTKFNLNGNVVLTARKKKADECFTVDQESMDLLRELWDEENIPSLMDKPFPEIVVEGAGNEIKFFRGSALDVDELLGIYQSSSATAEFWRTQDKLGQSNAPQNPLLPFNVGQLGLVLTSGSLDGVIDEGYGFCHIVKGRVVKTTDTSRSMVSNTGGSQMEMVSTTSNRVEINILLPDGTHKVLA